MFNKFKELVNSKKNNFSFKKSKNDHKSEIETSEKSVVDKEVGDSKNYTTEQLYINEIEKDAIKQAKNTPTAKVDEMTKVVEVKKPIQSEIKKEQTISKFSPKNVEEVSLAIKYLARNKAVIINFANLEKEDMKLAWSFCNGAIIALNGEIAKVASKNYKFSF